MVAASFFLGFQPLKGWKPKKRYSEQQEQLQKIKNETTRF